tara:strand:+ start:1775 stop:1921 length:147 start_codon:yes stop_codon:yes gene_type:complete
METQDILNQLDEMLKIPITQSEYFDAATQRIKVLTDLLLVLYKTNNAK